MLRQADPISVKHFTNRGCWFLLCDRGDRPSTVAILMPVAAGRRRNAAAGVTHFEMRGGSGLERTTQRVYGGGA